MMENEQRKISIIARLLGLSIWMFLFSWEGSFSIQSIIPFIFCAIIVILLRKNTKFKLDKCQRKLLYVVFLIIISTCINSIIYIDVSTIYNLVGVIYFILIFIWFYICTKEKYNMREIKYIIINYILVSTILSILTIRLSLSGVSGKIAITNFVGTLTDENWTSALISLAPIYTLMLILYEKNKVFTKLILAILFIINILGICLTGSRAALLGCLLGLFLTFGNYYFSNKISIEKIFLVAIVVIGFICFAIFAKDIMPEWIFDRYFESDYMDNSNTTRLLIWKNAINGILDQPLIGFGMGSFSFLEKYEYTAGVSVPGHNTYLDIALYSGIIGLIVYLLFIWDIVKDIVLKRDRRKFIGILATLLFISCIVGADKTVFLWNTLILLKIINQYMDNKEEIKNEHKKC